MKHNMAYATRLLVSTQGTTYPRRPSRGVRQCPSWCVLKPRVTQQPFLSKGALRFNVDERVSSTAHPPAAPADCLPDGAQVSCPDCWVRIGGSSCHGWGTLLDCWCIGCVMRQQDITRHAASLQIRSKVHEWLKGSAKPSSVTHYGCIQEWESIIVMRRKCALRWTVHGAACLHLSYISPSWPVR